MHTIQNIIVDSLNGFAINQIPLFIFQLLCAGLGAHILQIVINKKLGEVILSYGAIIAVVVAIITSIAKYSVPISIIGAAAILLLFKAKETHKFATIAQFVVVFIGLGCGSGSVIQTIIGMAVLLGVILFTPLKK